MSLASLAVLIVALVGAGVVFWKTGHLERWAVEFVTAQIAKGTPQDKPWPPEGWKPGDPLPPDPWPGPHLDAARVEDPRLFFDPTNIWLSHLHFTGEQWTRLGPRRIPPVPGFIRGDGKMILRNPVAKRNGVLGALGYEFDWSAADFEVGGVVFTNVGVRFKGNGTFIGALHRWKKPFKVDLDRHEKGRSLAGLTTLNFGNLSADMSCLSEALGYECCREAGLLAPRTAFARLFLSIDGRFERRPLGLYTMTENVDGVFARQRWGTRKMAIFKPVTYDLFGDWGDDWKAYEAAYDPKTKVGERHWRRLIETARLVTHASEEEFERRIGEHVDRDNFARFLACMVWMSSYDGYLNNGQNFLLYLDPVTERWGFLPWDLDHAWGEFEGAGRMADRENASIFKPSPLPNRFLDRMLAMESFRMEYLRRLEDLSQTVFRPDRLCERIDALAEVIRPALEVETPERLGRFEAAISDDVQMNTFQLKRFIHVRALSVSGQLAGQNPGAEIRAGFRFRD